MFLCVALLRVVLLTSAFNNNTCVFSKRHLTSVADGDCSETFIRIKLNYTLALPLCWLRNITPERIQLSSSVGPRSERSFQLGIKEGQETIHESD